MSKKKVEPKKTSLGDKLKFASVLGVLLLLAVGGGLNLY